MIEPNGLHRIEFTDKLEACGGIQPWSPLDSERSIRARVLFSFL